MSKHMSNTFMNVDLKKHRKNVMMNKQKILLPDTQIYVERELEFRKFNEPGGKHETWLNEIKEYEKEIDKIRKDLIEPIYKKVHALRIKIYWNERKAEHWNKHYDLTYDVTDDGETKKVTRETSKFVRACPAEGCKGFLSGQWKCGLCHVKVCEKCHEIKNETADNPHVCNEDNVKTAEKIMKDTKPCPSCSSLIFKISGCDQMWCTQCQTAFSWKTGDIERKVIHNPHYYQWMRSINNGILPRVRGDVVGGGDNCHHRNFTIIRLSIEKEVLKDANEIGENVKNMVDDVEMFHMFFNHIQMIELPKHQGRTDDKKRVDDLSMRIKWMVDEIDEKKWQKNLYYFERRDTFNKDVSDVYELFMNVGRDIINKIHQKPKDVVEFLKELYNLLEYVNTYFKDIYNQYKYIVPNIYKTKTSDYNEQWRHRNLVRNVLLVRRMKYDE